MYILKNMLILLGVTAFSANAASLKFTGEGDILNKTCTIPFETRKINMGDFSLSDIKNAAEGEMLRQKDESLLLTDCTEDVKMVHIALQFNAYPYHPQWIEPQTNPSTGVMLGIAKSPDGDAMNSGDIIAGEVDIKQQSALIPIFINAYAHHVSAGKYSLGESKSTVIFTLTGN